MIMYGFFFFSLSVLFECDFGINDNTDMCGMEQDQNNDIDWELTTTSGDAATGPSSDHTGNTGDTGKVFIHASYGHKLA